MGLLDFDLNKLKSFDYKKVGQKQGEYFGEDNATGFTPNRQAGDTTEYISNSTTKLGLDGINFPGPVNYFQDDNATGFTIGRQPGDETEYNTESSIYREGFPGPVDFFLNTNATGYTLNRNEGDPTEYVLDPNSSIYKQGFPGPVDYFLNTASERANPQFKTRMKPPLARMRLGDLYGNPYGETREGILGFIKSLSYTFPDESPWETRHGQRVPKIIDVQAEWQVIHEQVPSMRYPYFYGYNPKKETDTDIENKSNSTASETAVNVAI